MNWRFEVVGGPYGGVTEGPAWDGECLLFTHIPTSQILSFNPASGETTLVHSDTHCANGLMLDPNGQLFACQGDQRRVVRYEKQGGIRVLADQFHGKRLNIPNDLAIDLQGRVWFTDPYYEGAAGAWSMDRSNKDLDHDSVYRLDPRPDDKWSIHRVTFDTTRPNGVLLSLDYNTLYVAQSGRRPEEKRELRAYPIESDGSLGPGNVLHDFGAHRGIDGMCLDQEGKIVATAGYRAGGPGPAIYIFSPSGDVLEIQPLPVDRPTNCTFGGPNLSPLYITSAEGYLLSVPTEQRGRLLYP